MKSRYTVLISSLAIVTMVIIAVACLLKYANRERYVIRVVNSTSKQVSHVQVVGLDKIGSFGVLLPGIGKSVDLVGNKVANAISIRFTNMNGNLASTGTILEPTSEIAGRQFDIQINPDQSVSVTPRDLTLREKLSW
jgi:hypothetical protein